MSQARFLGAAYLDIRAAFEWYDAQRPGLGDDLIELASIAMQVNVALERRLAAAPECDEIAALLA